MSPSLCPASSCSIRSLTLAVITSFAVCALEEEGRVATLVFAVLFMVALLSLVLAFGFPR